MAKNAAGSWIRLNRITPPDGAKDYAARWRKGRHSDQNTRVYFIALFHGCPTAISKRVLSRKPGRRKRAAITTQGLLLCRSTVPPVTLLTSPESTESPQQQSQKTTNITGLCGHISYGHLSMLITSRFAAKPSANAWASPILDASMSNMVTACRVHPGTAVGSARTVGDFSEGAQHNNRHGDRI